MPRRLLCLAVALVCAAAQAAITPHPLFSEGCVLQRDLPLPVWGTAAPGEQVTVAIAGQSKTVTAGADGRWSLKLDALPAGGPHTLRIGEQTIGNVLIGEVWLASGQSNMAFTVAGSDTAEQAIANSANDQLRLLTVPNKVVDEPSSELGAVVWKAAGPDSVKGFSARLLLRAGAAEGPEGAGRADQLLGRRHAVRGLGDARKSPGQARTEASCRRPGGDPAAGRGGDAQVSGRDHPEVQQAVKDARAAGKPTPRRPQPPYKNRACGHYHGMIAPLAPYAVRGAIWYQGEANTQNAALAYEYRILLPQLIEGWRQVWGQDRLDFYFVQLPAYGAAGRDPNSWPLLRESMAQVAATHPQTGMAVTIDLGDEQDIHPKKKEPVGQRLEQAAMALTYGADVLPGGPLFESMKVEGDAIRLTFTQTDGGLTAKGELVGFEVAGEDQVYHPATATIAGDDVVVTSPAVAKPVAARYAWANWAKYSLFSEQGLPACPFRTDTWNLVPAE